MAIGGSSFGALTLPSINGTATQTTAPSEQSAALLFSRRLQESERHRLLLNYFAFYNGTHYSFIRDAAEPQIVINYSRAFIDKFAEFLYGNSWTLQTESGVDTDPTVEFLKEQWRLNDKDKFCIEMATMGGISGDAFVKLAYSPDEDRIVFSLLDTNTCFPIYTPGSRDEFDSFKIEYIISSGPAGDYNDIHLYTEIYTPNSWLQSWDGNIERQITNPYGFVPIVQVRNLWEAQSYYGRSDIKDQMPLQRIFNEQTTKFQDIVNYHAEPVTVIYGVRMNQLTKGARKVWSGLPINAKVENLSLESDLPALQTFIDKLKTQMHEVSSMPENILGKEQAISNTSNAALQTMYLPIVQRTNTKRINYGSGMARIDDYAIRIWNLVHPNALDPDIIRTINWESPLPKDTAIFMSQELMPKLQAKLISRLQAIKELGYTDPDAILAEADKDLQDQADTDLKNQVKLANAMPQDPTSGAASAQQNPKPKSDSQSEGQDTSSGGLGAS